MMPVMHTTEGLAAFIPPSFDFAHLGYFDGRMLCAILFAVKCLEVGGLTHQGRGDLSDSSSFAPLG